MRWSPFSLVSRQLASPVRGQTLILFALLLNFVFLGIVALAVDIALYHAERRKLQNAADTAALATAERYKVTHDSTTASASGWAVVDTNLDPDLTHTNELAGGELMHGITVSTSDGARVALKYTFEGIFSRAIGVPNLTVRARARAVLKPPDLLMPIAVKRFGHPDPDTNQQPDLRDPITASNPIYDYLCNRAPWGDPSITALPAIWPAPMTGPTTCTAGSTASPERPGPVIPVLGADVKPNKPPNTSSFNGWVAPDVRDGGAEYEHGVTSSSDHRRLTREYVENFGGYPLDDVAAPSTDGTIEAIDGLTGVIAVDVRKLTTAITARYGANGVVMVAVSDGTTQELNGHMTTKVIGYALFRLTGANSNTIYGEAVSGLKASPNDFTELRRVALGSW